VVIQNVVEGSSAAEAGLERGDVIHRVNRTPVASVDALGAAMRSLNGAKEVVLQIEREGQLSFITVNLG
jgi:S1-C subfamily serine protease